MEMIFVLWQKAVVEMSPIKKRPERKTGRKHNGKKLRCFILLTQRREDAWDRKEEASFRCCSSRFLCIDVPLRELFWCENRRILNLLILMQNIAILHFANFGV